MNQHMKKRVGRLSDWALAAALAAIAAVISPIGIEFATGRHDLSLRVNVASWTFDAFLVIVIVTVLSRDKPRRIGFYAIAWAFPFVLLAGAELFAISIRLADRIAPLSNSSVLTRKGPWPGYLLSDARYYQTSGLRLYRPWHGDGITLNRLGLRTALPAPRKAGEWRIAVTGGSAVWGWRVRDADTIPVQLQAILHRTGHRNVSVYNFGIEGATLKGELALLKHFRRTYSIDQVLFYTGANNVTYAYLENARTRSGPWSAELATFELIKAAQRFQVVHSEPSLQTLQWLDTNVVAPALKNNSLRRDMMAAYEYCRQTELRCDFALQPMLLQRKAASGVDAEMARVFRRVYPRFGELTVRMYEAALASGPSGHVIDLTRIFDRTQGAIFQDTTHVSEAGNQIAAASLAPIVASRLP